MTGAGTHAISGIAVTGWGVAAPHRVVTNADLEATLDTSDAWIRSRSGIASRRWADPGAGETTAALASEAVAAALKEADRTPDEVGLLVLASCTPDQALPHTSAAVCDAVGLGCGSFDLVGACAGFVDGLVVASGLVGSAAGPVVLAGAERMTAIFDPADRTTAVLFGDGAGALVLEPGNGALLAWDAGTDGSLRALLEIPPGERFLHMDGAEVFRRAVRIVCDSSMTALGRAGLTPAAVDVFVPHQANARIIEAARARLGIPHDRTIVNVDRWGNTSAASIAIALAESAAAGRIRPGDVVLLTGFGAGMTWSTALLRWGTTDHHHQAQEN
jgi:3-oxoacyl-[acyl-carrier-protein] synthase-3